MMTKQNEVEEECFAPINPNKPNIVDSDTIGVGYDKNYKQISPSNINCVAKVVTDTVSKTEKYFIKINRQGKFFDPAKDVDAELLGLDKITQRPIFEFKKVQQSTFQLYSGYLSGKSNNSLLLQAEREMR